jgi:hypothetical protein
MKTPTLEPSRCLPIRSIFTWNGARWTCAGALRKFDRRERGVAWETPLPGIAKPR